MFFAQLTVITSLEICPEIEPNGDFFSEAVFKDN